MQKFIDEEGKVHEGVAITDRDENTLKEITKVLRRAPTYDYDRTALMLFSVFLMEKRDKEIVTTEIDNENEPPVLNIAEVPSDPEEIGF